MKKLLLIFSLLLTSYSYSQELMNFYLEPNGDDVITLETLVYRSTFSFFSGSTISYLDNTITVSLCYLNSSSQAEIFDPQSNIINLPIGYSTYTVNVEIFGDNDGDPCSVTNLVDTGTITFDYPYNPTETTYIPDNVFEGYLEDLGFGDDITNNDFVFTHRIENMTYLFLYPLTEDIFSMEGINAFIELKELRCGSNQISGLDTSQNLKLERLWCQNNPITELDLINNENLTWLEAGGMNLTELDVTQNLNLEILTLGSNNISSIDVSQNINLKKLYVTNNNMENIDISNNILLEEFSCGANLMTSLNTSNNINLKELYFNDSFITEIDLTNNLLLEILFFNHSLLTDLDTSSLINLKWIDAWSNQLTALDFSNNSQLEQAFLVANNLTSLNLKNGNNVNITELVTVANDELFCIDVDDPDQAPYPGWNVDDQVVFSEDCSLGIEDVLTTQVLLYPNPVQHVLTIENNSNDNMNSIKIYDVMGRMVFHLDPPTNSLDVSNLEAGLFFVSIKTEQGDLIKKFVKE